MTEPDDHQLLAEFARENSEAAFAALVSRHINLVYSVALRSVGNNYAAEEITQAVFIILARKAKSLSRKIILSGWLYQTTRLTAANFLRTEIRRQKREQEAYMQSTLNEPESEAWRRIAPLLDDALSRLGEKDRNAVVLRFFENKNLQEVGLALGASEAAAKMRVNRALEKLRKIFTRRGVTLSAALIAGAVSANSVQAAPAGLTATISVTAAKGAAVAVHVTTLVKGTLKLMTYAKLKLALGITAGILLAAGTATVAIPQINGGGELTPEKIIKKSQAAYAALSSYSASGKVIAEVANQTIPTTFTIRLQRPNLYYVEWTQTTAFFTNGGIVWSAGNGDFLMTRHGQYNAQPGKYQDMQSALAAATGISGSASATIPAAFFNQSWGNVLKINPAKSTFRKLKDEPVEGVDCFVLSIIIGAANLPNNGELADNAGKIGKRITTLWIGKQDYLIHQAQTIVEGASIALPRVSDATIEAMLKGQKKPVTPETMSAMRTQLETINKQVQNSIETGEIISTQTHENIVVNQKFSPADFTR